MTFNPIVSSRSPEVVSVGRSSYLPFPHLITSASVGPVVLTGARDYSLHRVYGHLFRGTYPGPSSYLPDPKRNTGGKKTSLYYSRDLRREREGGVEKFRRKEDHE